MPGGLPGGKDGLPGDGAELIAAPEAAAHRQVFVAAVTD